jgi:tRNA(Arg) A34 adenosine deaminase TadA
VSTPSSDDVGTDDNDGQDAWIAAVRRERDALAFLGLLAGMYQQFDPPVPSGEDAATHRAGLNIHALLIDNVDGEVIALGRNRIHATENPTQHAEQRAIRRAVGRIRIKRPRPTSQTVEQYYRASMFTGGASGLPGVLRGVTLVSTLEPCPMCATTALVCRMARVAYIVNDTKYGGLWERVKETFYAGDVSEYGQLNLVGAAAAPASAWLSHAAELHRRVLTRADALRASTPAVRDTHVFDFLGDELADAFAILLALSPADLAAHPVLGGPSPNRRTLRDLQRACNIPLASALA